MCYNPYSTSECWRNSRWLGKQRTQELDAVMVHGNLTSRWSARYAGSSSLRSARTPSIVLTAACRSPRNTASDPDQNAMSIRGLGGEHILARTAGAYASGASQSSGRNERTPSGVPSAARRWMQSAPRRTRVGRSSPARSAEPPHHGAAPSVEPAQARSGPNLSARPTLTGVAAEPERARATWPYGVSEVTPRTLSSISPCGRTSTGPFLGAGMFTTSMEPKTTIGRRTSLVCPSRTTTPAVGSFLTWSGSKLSRSTFNNSKNSFEHYSASGVAHSAPGETKCPSPQ